MRKCARVSILALPLIWLLPAASSHAQGLNVTGSWSIQMQTVPRAGGQAVVANSCSFQGAANVSQAGSQFGGDISVNETSGGMACPSSMSAGLNGTVNGNTVNMGVVMGGGALGTANFTGAVTGAPVRTGAAPVRTAATTMGGSFAVTGGPFSGTGGTWSATQLAPLAAVPALDAKGLAALALLLVATGLWFLLRRSALRRR